MKSRIGIILVIVLVLVGVGAASIYASNLLLTAAGSGVAAQMQQTVQPLDPPPQPADYRQANPEKGLLVTSVVASSPAMQAGLHRGCVILAADGQEVNLPGELDRAVTAHKVGDSMRLSVSNCGRESEIVVTLANAPRAPDDTAAAGDRPWLGVIVMPPAQAPVPSEAGPESPVLTDAMSPVLFVDETGAPRGVAVVGVTPGSPAAQAGLQPVDVIVGFAGQPDFNPNLLFQVIANASPGDPLELTVWRDGQTRTVHVVLGARPGQPGRAYFGVYAWSAVGGR